MGQHNNDYTKYGKHSKFNLGDKINNKDELKEDNIVEESSTIEENTKESESIECEEMTKEEVETLTEDDVIDIKESEIINDTVVLGTVFNCAKLNVRKLADKNSDPVAKIDNGDIVKIDMENSTNEFYKVLTKTNISGYCVKEFIKIN